MSDLVATLTVDCGATVETLQAPLLVLVDVTFQGQPVVKIVDTDGDEQVSAGDRALVTDSAGLACNALGRSTSPLEIAQVVENDAGSLSVDFAAGGAWVATTIESSTGPGGLTTSVELEASPSASGISSLARNTSSVESPSFAGPVGAVGPCTSGIVTIAGPGL